jgi:uncharacterized membrane protein YfcA
MSLDAADLVLAGAATLGAGAINALAGGGTLISFPALVAIGVPSLPANVTNTVSLCPGYFAGTFAQREDLAPQLPKTARLAVAALAGALVGSGLLQVTPERDFRAAVPWLILVSCALLLGQDRIRGWVRARSERRAVIGDPTSVGPGPEERLVDEDSLVDRERPVESARPSAVMFAAVFAASVYGGFFGAGLGIMLLGILGLFSDDSLVQVNAVKQALSLVINVSAAVLFAFTGHVRWELVPVMAVAALIGGTVGGRLTRVVNPTYLRRVVVLFGIAVAVQFWVS